MFDSLDLTYLLFAADGTPLRVRVGLSMTEWRGEDRRGVADRSSPPVDAETMVTLGAGDTVSSLALRMGTTTSRLCSDNGIDDPLRVEPGTRLMVRHG